MSRELSNEMKLAAEMCGKTHGVAGQIHPDDYLFWNIYDSVHTLNKMDSAAQYFDGGASSADFIKTIVESLPLPRPLTFLDFAAGYARVARHIKVRLPYAEVTTCDIHQEAVDFNKSIGLDSILSSTVPEEFLPNKSFDVIFAMSFFTHMPSHTWGRWLRSIAANLKLGGMLIFTAHGHAALSPMGVTTVDPSGFRFDPHSEQKDLDLADYGSTVTLFDYVYQQSLNANLRLVRFNEAGAGYQDYYVLTQAAVVSPRPTKPTTPTIIATIGSKMRSSITATARRFNI